MKTLLMPLVVLALAVQGCSYAISSDMVRQTDRTLTFDRLQADPDTQKGKTVILGGIITQVQSIKNGTLLEIIEKKIDFWGKPIRTERSGGRFLVLYPRQVDIMVYAPGRPVTVAGEVAGTGERLAGQNGASLVLLRSRELKLWPQEQRASDVPQWIDPLYDPQTPQGKYGY